MSRLAAIFVTLAALFFVRAASAQTITVFQEQSLPRLDKDGKQVQKRPQNLTPEAINLQDCVDDQRIRLPLQLSGFVAEASIQVWASIAGQECKAQTARAGGVQTCWRVVDTDVPLQLTTQVDIPVRRIISGVNPPFSATQPNATAGACGRVNLTNVAIHLLYFAPGNPSEPTVSKTLTIQADTVGPNPPSGLRALPGNTRISVSWTAISGSGAAGDASSTAATSGTGLTELTGINVYCVPAGGGTTQTTVPGEEVCTDEPIDAGDEAGDAGTVRVCRPGDASVVETPTEGCSIALFGAGIAGDGGTDIFPDNAFNEKYKCGGTVGNTGSAAVAESVGGQPLVNGTQYAVAVAATDKFNNVGKLSNPICQTPEQTTDFWTEYRGAGGQAGGCAQSTSDAPTGTLAAFGTAIALGVSLVRRRKRS
jgi:MYXO-CTERM domain-containing protein